MKKLITVLLSFCLVVTNLPCVVYATGSTPNISADKFAEQLSEMQEEYEDEPLSNRLIVVSERSINELDSVDIVEGCGDLHIVQFDNSESAEEALEYYESNKYIESVEEDAILSTTEFELSGSDICSTYGNHLSWGSESICVDDYIDTLSYQNDLPEVVVGIIDTGIDIDHEFLNERVIETGFNVSGSGDENSEDDDQGHGTHVAGIIVDNTTDNVKIKGYKALSAEGHGYASSVATAIEKATYDKVNVINMSLGFKGESYAIERAVNNALRNNITVCVSAGNSGADAAKFCPAGIEGCITVSVIDETDQKPYWGNWGDIVDIVAPGISIYSSYMDNSYKTLSGTSMSSPFVAAASALLITKNINYTPDEIRDTLCDNGRQWWFSSVDNGLKHTKALALGGITDINYERTPQPFFDIPSGRYLESITVSITCSDKDAEIYYTTDGSRATNENGILYTEPIVIDKVTRLNAAAYSEGKQKSVQNSAIYYLTYIDENDSFEIDSDGIITSYSGTNNYLTIPETINGITVTGIGDYVFSQSGIVMIKLPDTLTYIGSYAFFDCDYLYSVDAKNIEIISPFAFKGCRNLELFSFENAVTIGRTAFGTCTKISSVYAEKLESIGMEAFILCDDIINVYIPNCKSIGDYAFRSNYLLENITMDSVESIGNYGFASCKLLKELYTPNVKSIGYATFDYCKSLSIINIVNCTGKLGNRAFRYCPVKIVNIPKITELGNSVFAANKELKYMYAPNLTSIGDGCISSSADVKCIFGYDGSYLESWSTENNYSFGDINTLVKANGKQIRITNPGLRFGFYWNNIDDLEELSSEIEYGFIYHYNSDDSVFTSNELVFNDIGTNGIIQKPAKNYVNTTRETEFNLVFIDIPTNAYMINISVRAYVCIDDMYFYSNTLDGSFQSVSNKVLDDDEMPSSIKRSVKKLLDMEV